MKLYNAIYLGLAYEGKCAVQSTSPGTFTCSEGKSTSGNTSPSEHATGSPEWQYAYVVSALESH